MTDLPERIWTWGDMGGTSACLYAEPIFVDGCEPYTRADLSPSPEVVKELVEALRWYGEQARLARLIHSEGDAGRQAISDDGGKRARAVLAKLEGGE